MKIQFDASAMADAAKVATSLAPPQSGNIVLNVARGIIQLITMGESSSAMIIVPGKVHEEGMIALDAAAFQTAVRGRGEMNAVLTKSAFNLSAGNFKIGLPTVEAINESTPNTKEWNGHKVSPEQGEWLKWALQQTNLGSDKQLGVTSHYVSLSMSGTGAVLCCYDNDRMAYAYDKKIKGDLDVALPRATLLQVASTFSATHFKFQSENGVLRAWNKLAIATFSLIAPQFTLPTEQLVGRIKESRHEPKAVWSFDNKEVKEFLSNARAVLMADSKTALTIALNERYAQLKIHSLSGRAEIRMESCEVSTPIEFEVDAGFFSEMISVGLETIYIHDTYIAAHGDGFGHIMARNAPKNIAGEGEGDVD